MSGRSEKHEDPMAKTTSTAAKPASSMKRAAPVRIVYQGEPGANSHIACSEACPGSEPVACATFEDALAAVKARDVTYAMIPIENSLAGRVADIHHLLPNAGLYIVGEHFMPIHFQLMAVKGARLDGIKDVYSHIHALGQCRKIIRKLGARAHTAGDTAGSAREVAEWGDKSKAALAPRLAAALYKLEILAENVEDASHNATRFVILGREREDAPAGNGPVVTSFIFRVRNVPAALYKVLGGFATNSVNMTKLESYQPEGTFTATAFYADVEGHPSDPPLKRALEELDFFSSDVRLLGTYPASPFRKTALGRAGKD